MKQIIDTREKWMAKAFKKNADYIAIGRQENRLLFVSQYGAENILLLHIMGDHGDGNGLRTLYMYDTRTESAVPDPLSLLVHLKSTDDEERYKIILRMGDQPVHHVLGFTEEELEEYEDVFTDHPVQYLVVYIRTVKYHTFFFYDRETNDIRMIEDFAKTNTEGQALPDSITACMTGYAACHSVKQETKPDAEPVSDQEV